MDITGTAVEARQRRHVLVASAAAACVGWTTIFVQPVMLTEIMSRFHLAEAAAAMALTVEMLAVAAASILCARFGKGRSFIAIGMTGALVAAAGNAAAMLAGSYEGLLGARILAGIGEGIALMVAGAAPAGFADPDRAYAKINVATLLIGTAVVSFAPAAGMAGADATMFTAMLLAFLAAIPFIAVMPVDVRYQPMTQQVHIPVTRSIGALWLCFIVMTTASSAIVSLCGVFGSLAGLSAQAVNTAIAFSILSALAGSFLSNLVGAKLGRLMPMLAGITVITVMLLGMSQIHNPAVFRWSVSLQMLGVYFVLPYFMGAAAEADHSGRGVAALNAAIPLSYAAGPVLGGYLLENAGFPALAWLAILSGLIVAAILLARHPAVLSRFRARLQA